MEENIQTAFRLPASLLAKLDEEARRKARETPGASVSRADVVRGILLAHFEAHPLPKRGRR